MSTKSNRSSGAQHNQRGVVQGTTLVDPKTGFPVDVIQDIDGKRRLAVDAKITAQIDDVNVDLDGVGPGGDSVHLVDNVTGNKLKIESDGSTNSNVEIDALDGDNIAIKNSTSGNELEIESDGSANVVVNGPSTPTIQNVIAAAANTEYFYTFPTKTKRFIIRPRGNGKLQFSFIAGQSSSNFMTIFPGSKHEECNITIVGLTIYFQSNKAGETVEILSWA